MKRIAIFEQGLSRVRLSPGGPPGRSHYELDGLAKWPCLPHDHNMSVSGVAGHTHEPVYRPLKAGIYAPIPTFFLADSEDLGRSQIHPFCRI
jgi:hypothetical protein